jgi:hypothetical protein
MNNSLEVCNWLVKHPHILQLANKMLAASSLPLIETGSSNESSSSDTTVYANSTANKVYIILKIS